MFNPLLLVIIAINGLVALILWIIKNFVDLFSFFSRVRVDREVNIENTNNAIEYDSDIICTKCRKAIKRNSRYCTNCGRVIPIEEFNKYG